MQTVYDRVRRVIVQQAIGGELDLSVPDLARLARCSVRSVKYVLSALRDEDELELLARARQHYPARYRLARTLSIEFESRSARGHLGVVPDVQPGVQPDGQIAPLAEGQRRGGHRGGGHAHMRGRPPRRRRPLRADGTNPRAEATRAKERSRPPGAYEVCGTHGLERNGLGLCSGCRSERLAAGGDR